MAGNTVIIIYIINSAQEPIYQEPYIYMSAPYMLNVFSMHVQELIQNAEDAGATEISFLYDHRQWKKEKLFHPSLARFQVCQLLKRFCVNYMY